MSRTIDIRAGSATVTNGAPDAPIREVCHDLRQHIATIDTLTAAAQLVPELPTEAAEFLDHARQELELLRAFCRRIVESPRRPERIRLDDAAARFVEEARARCASQLYLSAEPCSIVADELEVRRVFENLLDNAAKAAGPQGRVDVSVRRRAGTVIVEVADSGRGFSHTSERGTGLGLVIVEQLARKQGWQALVDKSRLGGAVVRLVMSEAGQPERVPSGNGFAQGLRSAEPFSLEEVSR